MSSALRFPTPDEVRSLSLHEFLGANDRAFLQRIFSAPPERYLARLANVGLTGLDRVLDVGCGFGQWSLCLASTNRATVAIEPEPIRLAVLEQIVGLLEHPGLDLRAGRAEELPVEDASADGAFCFGVLQYSDPKRLLGEIARTLRPGGIAYVLGKDIGGYLHDWLERKNVTADFDPRRCAVDAFANTLSLETRGVPADGTRWGDRIVSLEDAEKAAREVGLVVEGAGEEASVHAGGRTPEEDAPFFRTEYQGLRNSYEIVVRKP